TYIWAAPKYDHAHASQWFSQLNIGLGVDVISQAVRNDIQPDRHFASANYLYVDGHVDVIPAATIDEWIAAQIDYAKPEENVRGIQRVFMMAVAIISITAPVARVGAHGTPIQVTVVNNSLSVTGGLADSLGFAPMIFVESTEEGDPFGEVNLP